MDPSKALCYLVDKETSPSSSTVLLHGYGLTSIHYSQGARSAGWDTYRGQGPSTPSSSTNKPGENWVSSSGQDAWGNLSRPPRGRTTREVLNTLILKQAGRDSLSSQSHCRAQSHWLLCLRSSHAWSMCARGRLNWG
jgi:hypothetical protein